MEMTIYIAVIFLLNIIHLLFLQDRLNDITKDIAFIKDNLLSK